MEEGSSVPAAVSHGFEATVEFKPVEHPSEPLVCDQPVTCPLPEPSILNVGLDPFNDVFYSIKNLSL